MVLIEVVVELPEHAPRVVPRGEPWIDAWLRIVVALILHRPEEPELVQHERARRLHRSRRATCRGDTDSRRSSGVGRVAAGQRVVLVVDVRVAVEHVAALARHDVEHGALHVAVFRRGAELTALATSSTASVFGQGVELMSVPSIWYEFSFVLLPSDCAAVLCPTFDVALTPGAELIRSK